MGKKVGGDIIQNKKTYLLITLLSEVNETDRKTLLSLLDEKDESKKVNKIKLLYSKYNISQKTTEKSDALYQEAISSLRSVSISDERKANLLTMAEMVHNRQF